MARAHVRVGLLSAAVFLSVAQGFASRTVAERRAQNERLFVMRFARPMLRASAAQEGAS